MDVYEACDFQGEAGDTTFTPSLVKADVQCRIQPVKNVVAITIQEELLPLYYVYYAQGTTLDPSRWLKFEGSYHRVLAVENGVTDGRKNKALAEELKVQPA